MNTAEENDVILTKRIRVLNNRRRTESQLEPLIILSASESLVNIMCGVMTHYYTCTHTHHRIAKQKAKHHNSGHMKRNVEMPRNVFGVVSVPHICSTRVMLCVFPKVSSWCLKITPYIQNDRARARFSIQKECIEKCLNSTIFWVCHVSGCASVMDQNYTTACDRDNFFFLENIFYDVFLRFYTDCIWTKKCNGKCLDRPKNKRSTFRASMRYNQTIFRWKISFAMEAKQHPLNIQSLVEFKLSLSLWFSDWTSKKEPISADFHYVNCRHMTQLH